MKDGKIALRFLVRSLLNEGQAEDLIEGDPELEYAFNNGVKNPVYLRWLTKMKEFEPVEDTTGLVQGFEKNKGRLAQKDINEYKTPGDLRRALEALGKSKSLQGRELKASETTTVFEDEEYKVVMPHTKESSCLYGANTTWCTAATQSANLFYNYVGRKENNVILYYIIKKGGNPDSNPVDKMCVGFVHGKPVFDGKRGGVTVDAANNGLKKNDLEKVLGEKFESIMDAMQKHCSVIGKEHPAKKAIQKIALSKNPNALEIFTRGNDRDERNHSISTLMQYELGPVMLSSLSNEKSSYVRSLVAKNPNTSPETLTKLANEDDYEVQLVVGKNPNTPIQALTKLSSSIYVYVQHSVAENPSTPAEILEKFSNEKSSGIKVSVAKNPNASRAILEKLASDYWPVVRSAVAENTSTPEDLLETLANDSRLDVKISVIMNPKISERLMMILASDENRQVRQSVAGSRKISMKIIEKLLNDPEPSVRVYLTLNEDLPFEVFEKLANDENTDVRRYLVRNEKVPQKILMKLKDDKDRATREAATEALARLESSIKAESFQQLRTLRALIRETLLERKK